MTFSKNSEARLPTGWFFICSRTQMAFGFCRKGGGYSALRRWRVGAARSVLPHFLRVA